MLWYGIIFFLIFFFLIFFFLIFFFKLFNNYYIEKTNFNIFFLK